MENEENNHSDDSLQNKPKRVGPKWLENGNSTNVKKSKKHEFRLAKELNGKREPRSGANKWSDFDNRTAGRDITTDQFLIEHKFTEKASISLKKEWLDKITVSSIAAFKQPMLIVTFQEGKKNEDWAMIPLDLLKILLNSDTSA